MTKPERKQGILLVFLATLLFVNFLKCEAFILNHGDGRYRNKLVMEPQSLNVRNVLSEPDLNIGRSNPGSYRHRRSAASSKRSPKRRNKKEDVWSSGRWAHAKHVEADFLNALEALQMSIKMEGVGIYPLPFPGIRDCNAALAAFGDGGDLLRALRLYFKMRKVASLSIRYPPKMLCPIPIPTLVTYSTLMSRAVKMKKPLVALRLWNIMRKQSDFFYSDSDVPTIRRIVPDVKAANILMNCYAKLGNLEAAQNLLEQMQEGGEDVPRMTPNLVTYNTLLDACHKSNDLDDALEVKDCIEIAGIRPDARTYTTLIATVARKASVASGANDPTLAFSLLQEMQTLHIRPNGMTYSALIDACGRCRRSDLALKGLRLMLDQKASEQSLDTSSAVTSRYTLSSEVGAWTAAINACGKAGRIDTAVKLFHSMPNFGVSPNTVTCGCLADCLLRNGRIEESLALLRYMKKNRIAPSEVMYTSLMTSAGRLAKLENERMDRQSRNVGSGSGSSTNNRPIDISEAKAVDVYAELMGSLMQTRNKKSIRNFETPLLNAGKKDDSTELYRVWLVFQEMKAAGVKPDIACYNAMLRSCATAGDIRRAQDILDQVNEAEDLEPNSKTWTEMIRAAGKAGRVDVALSSWKSAVEQIGHDDDKPVVTRKRGIDTELLHALLLVLVGTVGDRRVDDHTALRLHQLVFKIYEAIMSESDFLGMKFVSRERMFRNPRIMLTFLHAIVDLEKRVQNDSDIDLNSDALKKRATEIVMSDSLRNGVPKNLRMNKPFSTAHRIARGWNRDVHMNA